MKDTTPLLRVALVAALLMGLLASPTLALNISWTNGGTMGVDPFGHLWDADNNQANGDGFWGIPDLFGGTQTWSAPDFITRMKFTFFNLPPGVNVDPLPAPPNAESTRFFAATDNQEWNRVIKNNSVLFVAPDQFSQLDPTEDFLVNVAFDGPIDVNNLFFEATYSMNPVPEPSTILLLGTGLAGLAAMARRKD